MMKLLLGALLVRSSNAFQTATTTTTTTTTILHHSGKRIVLRLGSVTGPIYRDEANNSNTDTGMGTVDITLFTKEGCTLCDTAKEVLQSLRSECPHSLRAIDITDADQTYYWDKYKYDIPVLHLNGQYWTKHRITANEAKAAIQSSREGTFQSPPGEPNATAMEQRTTKKERKKQ